MQNGDLTAQERAGKIAWLLAQGERLTTNEIARLTGLTRGGAWYLMMRISRVVPVVCDERGEWCKIEVEMN